jgi:guanyl-specific ribonuclease Sa/uncharacterized protein YoxC
LSDGIDKTASSIKIYSASSVIKKTVIPKKEEWDDGDINADSNIAYNAHGAQKYLNNLLKGLLSYSNYKKHLDIYILHTAKVQAMAYWGVDVRITRGMFNMIYDEAELAGLIGHEIGHNALNHLDNRFKTANEVSSISGDITDAVLSDGIVKRIIKDEQKELIKTGWSRQQEKEADRYGAELAAKAGYDPYALCDLFERLANRINLGLVYKLKKLEGSHPALDDRAKSLRQYLKDKEYQPSGNRNRQKYLDGMKEVFAMSSEELSEYDKKLQEEIDEEAKKDLDKLDKIYSQLDNKKLTIDYIFDTLDEITDICSKYGISSQELFENSNIGRQSEEFMEESIVQDEPFTKMFAKFRDKIKEKATAIVNWFDRTIHKIPYIGDALSSYEALKGYNLITGEELTLYDRVIDLTFAMLATVGPLKTIAKDIVKSFEKRGVKNAEELISQAVKKIENNYAKNASKYQGKNNAVEMVEYLNKHNGSPPKNIVGGKEYQNLNKVLPEGNYKEYDLAKRAYKGEGGRGTERIVVNTTTGEVWYTSDHYDSFEKLEGIIFKIKGK